MARFSKFLCEIKRCSDKFCQINNFWENLAKLIVFCKKLEDNNFSAKISQVSFKKNNFLTKVDLMPTELMSLLDANKKERRVYWQHGGDFSLSSSKNSFQNGPILESARPHFCGHVMG